MKREQLGGEADLQQIKVLLKGNNPGWKQTGLTALKMGFNGEISLDFIAESLGVSVSSVSRWFATLRRDGLDAVLRRLDGIGRSSGLDEEMEAYLANGLQNSRWNTAQQAREELERHFGRPFNLQNSQSIQMNYISGKLTLHKISYTAASIPKTAATKSYPMESTS